MHPTTDPPRPHSAEPPTSAPPPAHQTILVAVDFSEHSQRALIAAANLAQAL